MYRLQLLDTHQRIKPYIHRTPVMTSRQINEISGAEIYFKCENFQRMGAFKMRGGINAVLALTDEQKSRGVVTHSSGNFAQAVALSAKEVGIDAYIIMPSNSPAVKVAAVKDYGGKVTLCPPTLKDRMAFANRVVEEKGATLLHPFNQIEVVMGQGTAAIELLEEQPDLNILMAPVGGGGLIAGTALAGHYFGKNCITIGGEPFEVDDAWRALQSGKIETNETINTIADGLRTTLGTVTFPLIREYVDSIIRVEEQEIVEAMRLTYERMKIIIEPSCAVPLAAVLRAKEKFAGQKVGIILSGGNVDLGKLPF